MNMGELFIKNLTFQERAWLGLFFWLMICLIPGIGQTGQEDISHQTHLNADRGPKLGNACTGCHQSMAPSSSDIDYSWCISCHSPEGAYDGVNDLNIGVRYNWSKDVSAIYNFDGSLKAGKERWCVGCHDDGICKIMDVITPNIAGQSISGNWQSPASLVDSDIPGAEKLLDNHLGTGNTGVWGSYVIFDLENSINISHIKLYTTFRSTTHWIVYGGNDLINWDRIILGQSRLFSLPTWLAGPQTGWNEIKVDRFRPIQYLKLERSGSWPLTMNSLREFRFKADLHYGYYETGHKILCSRCHDTASVHLDGKAQTYQSSLDNYQSGYRLLEIEAEGVRVLPLEIPRKGCNWGEYPRSDHDFALCFKCHDKYKLLGDAYGTTGFEIYPLQTNFCYTFNPDPNQLAKHLDANGKVINQHLRHLQGRGHCGNVLDWDSDWDGFSDSPQSCPACHNVHGSPTPAMTRHGELVSTSGTADKSPMFNLKYLDVKGRANPELLKALESIGGQTQFYGSGSGQVSKNNTCSMCHNDQVIYYRTPVPTCQGCHSDMIKTQSSHCTHIQSSRGPAIGCWDCHAGNADSPHTSQFTDGKSLKETRVCDNCHSPGGSYNGVDDPVTGAKKNWQEGIYQGKSLKLGKEKWCATCHDEEPARSKAYGSEGVLAPVVIGQENALRPYGYFKTGHGRNNRVLCTDCHDPDLNHIDHAHRTYVASLGNYQAGYRLKTIDGKASLTIRHTSPIIPDPTASWEDFILCFNCHNKYELLSHTQGQGLWHKDPPFETNFSTYRNEHYWHLAINVKNFCDSDFDGQGDAAATCTTCHNVHGSPSPAMIRHGELISPPGTQDYVPSFDFAWLKKDEEGSCTWRPNVPIEGEYKVYATWSDVKRIDPSQNSSQAKYKILHAQGESIVYLNQRLRAGKSPLEWTFLGSFSFQQGASGFVQLTSEDIIDTISSNQFPLRDALSYVIADAIKLSPLNGGTSLIVDNSSAEFQGAWQKSTSSTHYGNDFQYYRKSKRSENIALAESLGGNMKRSDSIINNFSCFGCHGEVFYAHPSLWPKTSFAPVASSAKLELSAISPGLVIFISVHVFDVDNDLATVTVDLSPICRSSSQPLYDDATHGDLLTNDHVYSLSLIIPQETLSGKYQLEITASDQTGKQDQTQVYLEIMGHDRPFDQPQYRKLVFNPEPRT